MSDLNPRRDQILDAASRLLLHYGPIKTTMADIAREAGIGVGSLYLEFSSKDAIIEALSEARHAEVLRAMRAAAAVDDAPSRRLRAVLRARVEAFLSLASCGAHAKDLLHCASCQPVGEAHGRFACAERRLLVEVIADGVRAGALDCDDPEATARVIVMAHAPFSPPWLFQRCGGGGDGDALRPLTLLHELLLRGLERRDGRG